MVELATRGGPVNGLRASLALGGHHSPLITACECAVSSVRSGMVEGTSDRGADVLHVAFETEALAQSTEHRRSEAVNDGRYRRPPTKRGAGSSGESELAETRFVGCYVAAKASS